MNVKVLYFAVARDRAGGLREEAIPLPEGATTDTLRAALGERHPQLVPILDRFRFAVNLDFASGPAALSDGDEVAVIPPVSGG